MGNCCSSYEYSISLYSRGSTEEISSLLRIYPRGGHKSSFYPYPPLPPWHKWKSLANSKNNIIRLHFYITISILMHRISTEFLFVTYLNFICVSVVLIWHGQQISLSLFFFFLIIRTANANMVHHFSRRSMSVSYKLLCMQSHKINIDSLFRQTETRWQHGTRTCPSESCVLHIMFYLRAHAHTFFPYFNLICIFRFIRQREWEVKSFNIDKLLSLCASHVYKFRLLSAGKIDVACMVFFVDVKNDEVNIW